MDLSLIPTKGQASLELQAEVHKTWIEAATQCGLDLTGFDPNATIFERIAWATGHGLEIGVALSRYSMHLQHSTQAQVLDATRFAVAKKIYVPPEFVCVDEAISGRKRQRDGLERARAILKLKYARVLLVFKVSRLFRVAYRGFMFFQEEVVDEGLRAISVSQGIDTSDTKTWKHLAYLHGIMDEMLLTTIADHVRSGIANLFTMGFVTGALTLGYMGVEVPGGRPTKRDRPRRMPKVIDEVAALIRQHYQWIAEGMPVREGWRRWVASNGPYDPRSTTRRMTYPAYRRMLSNLRYTGLWAFGRKRNVWNMKRDYALQTEQPETEVRVIKSEELRIVSDELFHAVQARLAKLKKGPRGPKRRKDPQLWDLVTDCFCCASCSIFGDPVQFYQAGANGHGMRCKHGDLCKSLTVVNRNAAVQAVIKELQAALARDTGLIEQVVTRAIEIDSNGDDEVRKQLANVDRLLTTLGNKIHDLKEMLGQGTEAERKELRSDLGNAMGKRTILQAEKIALQKSLSSSAATLTPEQVRQVLGDLKSLLVDGAAGKLGPDVIYKAAEAFRLLVGGRILVHVERRPGRKQKTAYGTFMPRTVSAVKGLLNDPRLFAAATPDEVRVWLRMPPKTDLLAEQVHVLIDIEHLSYRQAAKRLQAESHTINSGNVHTMYRRYYQMRGETPPSLGYNNGRRRKSRDDDAA